MNYILLIAVFIAAAIGLLLIFNSNPVRPVPENGQSVLDNNQNEWVMLRALPKRTFLFRSPKGRIRSQTLNEMKSNGFLNQFDFESIARN